MLGDIGAKAGHPLQGGEQAQELANEGLML